MVNEASGATATRLTPVVSISRPELNQETSDLSGTEGQKLPVEGNGTPQVQPQFQRAQASNDIQQAVREINEFVQNVQRDLSFNMDEASGRTVIRVIDRDSGDTIRQMPSEEVLAIATQIRDVRDNAVTQGEVPPGLLFSESA